MRLVCITIFIFADNPYISYSDIKYKQQITAFELIVKIF